MVEKVPRIVPGVDIRKFKLDPTDGFLVSRIDGKLAPKALARETGLPDFSVARALEKLEKLGIIEIVDPNAPPTPPAAAAAAPPPPPAERASAVGRFTEGLLAPKYDPKELDEPADLTPEQKKRILDFFYRLDDLDHYTLLGVTREAEKKGIKRAYFELAAVFHPDRYFKKELGSFKPKMEALFNRATEAHDTLVNAKKRAEYDAYLAEVDTTRGMEAMLERALMESARGAAEAERAAASAPPPEPPPPPELPPSPPGPSEEEIRRRKEALARRLVGGQRSQRPPQPSVVPTPQPSPLTYTNSQDAVDALRRRYEDRLTSATQAHTLRYVQAAEEALANNDVVAASTSLNLAAKYAPEDTALNVRAQEVKSAANKLLGESYLKQAISAERVERWPEAARLWQKLAKVTNDAHAHERTANAQLRSSEGDLHIGAEHAKQAIALKPQVIEYHITLIEIYLKAGLVASGKRAAEAAAMIDPKHEKLQALLKRFVKS